MRPNRAPAASGDARGARSPVVIGIGATGLRVASRLASRAGVSIRCLSVFAGSPPAGPTPVPTLTWPSSREAAALAARNLREHVSPEADGARGASVAVLVCNLGAAAAATTAPEVARALQSRARTVAAVVVEPFSFEGPRKSVFAEEASRALAPAVDVLAVAARDRVANVVGPQTPLVRACEVVDEVTALAAEALARTLARSDLGAIFGRPAAPSPVGAAELSGPDAGLRVAREALEKSLLSPETLAAARGAFVALAMGRAPTLGETAAAEGALRLGLSRGAEVTVEVATDPSLGPRVLAAVCAVPAAGARGGEAFPSEDAATLAIPAYLRRRSAGIARAGAAARRAWRRSA